MLVKKDLPPNGLIEPCLRIPITIDNTPCIVLFGYYLLMDTDIDPKDIILDHLAYDTAEGLGEDHTFGKSHEVKVEKDGVLLLLVNFEIYKATPEGHVKAAQAMVSNLTDDCLASLGIVKL